jgi:hypothetical protein
MVAASEKEWLRVAGGSCGRVLHFTMEKKLYR